MSKHFTTNRGLTEQRRETQRRDVLRREARQRAQRERQALEALARKFDVRSGRAA